MKKIITILLVAFIPLIMLGQDENKMVTKPYGFLKGDMVYATAGVYSFGKDNLSAPQLATGIDNPALGFTAQHSRFGLKISKGGDIKVGGKLELDFYSGPFDANGSPRMRQAFAYLATGNFEIRFGQQWDLYSPHNASTNNTNGNLWYAGNRGFRRPQVQLIYKLPGENITPMLQVAVCEGAKDVAGLGSDNKAATPMIQGRLSATTKDKYMIGVYFVSAKFSPEPDTNDFDFNTSGYGADVCLPIHKYFSLKGEFNYGTNLNNANLFTIAGSGAKDDDRKSLGFWFNATSKIADHFHIVVGFGTDQNQTDDLLTGAVESNTVIYGDLIIPITKEYSISLEVQNITTGIKDGDNNTATVINLSGKIVF